MKYRYQALNRDAQLVKGTIDASSEREALSSIDRQGLTPVDIAPAAVKVTASARSPSRQDLINALRQFATLLRSGISLVNAATALARSTQSPAIAEGFGEVAKGLNRGQPLSKTLAESKLALPRYLIELVRAGEMTGKLSACVEDALAQMEFDEQVARDVRGALTYPAVLVGAGILAVIIIFVAVVPRFTGLLDRAQEMPLLATAVLTGGQFFNAHWQLLAAGAAALGIVAFLQLRDATKRERLLALLAGLPGIRAWGRDAELARWSGLLATLLNHRVDIIDALELARSSVRTPRLRNALGEVPAKVRSGTSLEAALEPMDLLPPLGLDLIRVGEQSGQLAPMLNSLGEIMSDSARTRITRLVALLEPLAIIIIGAVIGLIMAGVILAINSINLIQL